MASGHTPASPEPEAKTGPSAAPGVGVRPSNKSQLPDDTETNLLTSKCPPGLLDDSVRTFIFKNEGHTLGNTLRDQLIKYPEVSFCGYSIPHPGENELHLRIQTHPGTASTATDVLRKGLEDIVEICSHLESVFLEEVEKKDYETEST